MRLWFKAVDAIWLVRICCYAMWLRSAPYTFNPTDIAAKVQFGAVPESPNLAYADTDLTYIAKERS
jgi:hypothetical protein